MIIKIVKKTILPGLGLVFLAFLFSLKKQPSPLPETPGVKGIQVPVKLSAAVGEHFLTLSGWTSPQATVYLYNSLGTLSAQTPADNTGFFLFKFVFLPYKIGELCLLAVDTNDFVSPPLCLPEPAESVGQDVFVENVLLPPTLLLTSGEILPGQTTAASGKTFPNSPVLVYLFSDPRESLWSKIKSAIVKTAIAKTAPILKIESDDQGDFEVNLPSWEPAFQRIFVAGLFDQAGLGFGPNYSPKSFTLSFKTLSFWEFVANFLLLILAKIYSLALRIAEDPTKIIWLEIPLLGFLIIKVGSRAITQKILEG